jgi:hypothetical protein
MRRFLAILIFMSLAALGLWADMVPSPGLGGTVAVPIGGGVDPAYVFSGSGYSGQVFLTLQSTGLADGSSLATSGTLDLTISPSLAVPTGSYELEAFSQQSDPSLPDWGYSLTGAFSADNLVYPDGYAAVGDYETGALLPYYVSITDPSYLTNGGLVFDRMVGSQLLEINIFAAGSGGYEFYAGWGAGNYPIADSDGSGVFRPDPSDQGGESLPQVPEAGFFAYAAFALGLSGVLTLIGRNRTACVQIVGSGPRD